MNIENNLESFGYKQKPRLRNGNFARYRLCFPSEFLRGLLQARARSTKTCDDFEEFVARLPDIEARLLSARKFHWMSLAAPSALVTKYLTLLRRVYI